jgi:hypothetical protein
VVVLLWERDLVGCCDVVVGVPGLPFPVGRCSGADVRWSLIGASCTLAKGGAEPKTKSRNPGDIGGCPSAGGPLSPSVGLESPSG